MKYKTDTVLCGYWCLYYLNERQIGILDVIYDQNFDEDNSDFISQYFMLKKYQFYINVDIKINHPCL